MIPEKLTKASCVAKASNLFGAEINGRFVKSDISFATSSAKPCLVFMPVPTANYRLVQEKKYH